MKLLVLTALLLAASVHADDQDAACSTPAYGACGSDSGITCCPNRYYCQPWNSGYYQCMPTPDKCTNLQTNVDLYGNDLKTVYGLQPEACCNECAQTPGCKAYTFVNNIPGSPACYLKSAAGAPSEYIGAVSGVLK